MICQAEKSVEVTNGAEMIEAIFGAETCEQQVTCNVDRPLRSIHVQTLPVKYFGRSQGTQTKEPKTMVTTGTQTYITSDLLSTLLSKPKMVSICSQTDPVKLVMNKDEKAEGNENEKERETVSINMQTALGIDRGDKDSDQEQSENESDGGESCDEESGREDNYSMTSGEDSEMEGCPAKDRVLDDEPIILTSEKSVKDQLKFIICEESIARTFALCLKCESCCSVLVTSVIGSYCKILISCSASAGQHIMVNRTSYE